MIKTYKNLTDISLFTDNSTSATSEITKYESEINKQIGISENDADDALKTVYEKEKSKALSIKEAIATEKNTFSKLTIAYKKNRNLITLLGNVRVVGGFDPGIFNVVSTPTSAETNISSRLSKTSTSTCDLPIMTLANLPNTLSLVFSRPLLSVSSFLFEEKKSNNPIYL